MVAQIVLEAPGTVLLASEIVGLHQAVVTNDVVGKSEHFAKIRRKCSWLSLTPPMPRGIVIL